MNRPARRSITRTPVWHYGELVQPHEVELPEQDLLLPDYRADHDWVQRWAAHIDDIHAGRVTSDDMCSCPGCWRPLPADELCGCDDRDYGPLCPACCRRDHQDERDPLEAA